MFGVGDVITGTPYNRYGVTTRGVICKVIVVDDRYESGRIQVEVIGVDEELLKKAKRGHLNFDRYVGDIYIVYEKYFEYYGSQTKFIGSSSELIDFIDGM